MNFESEASKPGLPSLIKSQVLDVAFDGYLKYNTYRVTVDGEPLVGGFVHGPGHFVSAVAALAFDQQMAPYCTFKTGDTRLSRFERGEPYVLHGIVAGRMDKEGATASKIVLAELAEEVGGEVVEGTFLPLGAEPSPTMPWESTEADSYYLAAVEITGTPYGDGGAMEVVDLIGPLILPVSEAMVAMDCGQVAEGGRARTMFGRGLDLIGYILPLGVYVHDHPRLRERFDTLGLGPVIDVRDKVEGSQIPAPQAKGESLESRINEVVCATREEIAVDGHYRMVAATTHHAVRDGEKLTTLGTPFLNQYLQLDYDRAKVARYYLDREGGPMLKLTKQAYPALAFAPGELRVERMDVLDVVLDRDGDALAQIKARYGGEPELLGEKTSASSGQCDLYYYLAAVQVPPTDGFVPLAEAIRLCRTDHGDSHTEALCQRLAHRLGWIPSLGMGLAEARLLLESPATV
jgi:hypothetical protein